MGILQSMPAQGQAPLVTGLLPIRRERGSEDGSAESAAWALCASHLSEPLRHSPSHLKTEVVRGAGSVELGGRGSGQFVDRILDGFTVQDTMFAQELRGT